MAPELGRGPLVADVHIADHAHEGFAHAQAVVVDEPKQGFVAGGV
jgi:hypothetical protein